MSDWNLDYQHVSLTLFASLNKGERFTGEQFTEYAIAILGYPENKNCLGACFHAFIASEIKAERAKHVGYIKSVRRSSHSRILKEYIKL